MAPDDVLLTRCPCSASGDPLDAALRGGSDDPPSTRWSATCAPPTCPRAPGPGPPPGRLRRHRRRRAHRGRPDPSGPVVEAPVPIGRRAAVAAAAFAATVAGKVVLGGAVAAAALGGLHATDTVDVPLLPRDPQAQTPPAAVPSCPTRGLRSAQRAGRTGAAGLGRPRRARLRRTARAGHPGLRRGTAGAPIERLSQSVTASNDGAGGSQPRPDAPGPQRPPPTAATARTTGRPPPAPPPRSGNPGSASAQGRRPTDPLAGPGGEADPGDGAGAAGPTRRRQAPDRTAGDPRPARNARRRWALLHPEDAPD